MGYCYDHAGLLCCDLCGRSGGVRRHRCPFNWCQPTAYCPSCWQEPNKRKLMSRPKHRECGCERNSQKFTAQQNEKQALMIAGQFVRTSALSVEDGLVHVLFINMPLQETVGYVMKQETYQAIPLSEPATPTDFERHGPIFVAAPTFGFGQTTKQVFLK